MEDASIRLLNKSIEAFVMGIEIYNKPTIRYRVEGFSFFICNAWELMLKSYLIKHSGRDSIFYPNNPHRTITLENCIQKVFTNKKDPLRLNLEKIIELRNTSTHYVTEDYEMIYAPLFQACVFNYIEKMSMFHNVDVTDHITQSFLTLAFRVEDLDPSLVRAKYSPDTADKLLRTKKELESLSKENNPSFSIEVNHNFYITKKPKDADAKVRIASDGETPVHIIKELKDPSNTHKYSRSSSIREIHNIFEREKIPFSYYDPYTKKTRTNFTTGDFHLFLDFYDLKENPRYTFKHVIGGNPQYSYSHSLNTFIVDEVRKDPKNIIKNLKSEIKKRNEKKR